MTKDSQAGNDQNDQLGLNDQICLGIQVGPKMTWNNWNWIEMTKTGQSKVEKPPESNKGIQNWCTARVVAMSPERR